MLKNIASILPLIVLLFATIFLFLCFLTFSNKKENISTKSVTCYINGKSKTYTGDQVFIRKSGTSVLQNRQEIVRLSPSVPCELVYTKVKKDDS